MPVNKRIKIGGSYYKGFVCAVSAAIGAYTQILALSLHSAISSISITPDAYGSGDTMSLVHYDNLTGTGNIKAIIAETIYNMGAGAPITFELPAAELLTASDSIKFTYNNTSGKAMNIYIIIEYLGLTKTS